MFDQFERDVGRWLFESLEFKTAPGEGELGLARVILQDFWSLFPEYRTKDPDAIESQLNAIAVAAGHANAERMFDRSFCHSDGGRSIWLENQAKLERLRI